MVRDNYSTIEYVSPDRDTGHAVLVSYSLPWKGASIFSVLKEAPASPRLFWQNGDHALVGWGEVRRLTSGGPQRFVDIQAQAKQLFNGAVQLNSLAPPSAGPRLVGGFSFQRGAAGDQVWDDFPEACFILPEFQLTSQAQENWITINQLVDPWVSPAEMIVQLTLRIENLRFSGTVSKQTAPTPMFNQPLQVHLPVSLGTWREMVEGAVTLIQRGAFEKVVLARTMQTSLPRPPVLESLMSSLGERYPDCYRFLIEMKPGKVFLGATPELLVKVQDSVFRTSALAGTIARGETPEEDQALGMALLESAKDRQEQEIVVRAMTEKLQPLVTELVVGSQPHLRRLRNVQHLETPVNGRLADCCRLLDVVAALHPTPALGGWPAESALNYLRKAEPFSRGWYAAPVGWFDQHGNGLFAVAIRSGLIDGRDVTLFAGAGIVADSDPDKEWQETGLKFRPLLEALQGA